MFDRALNTLLSLTPSANMQLRDCLTKKRLLKVQLMKNIFYSGINFLVIVLLTALTLMCSVGLRDSKLIIICCKSPMFSGKLVHV